MSSVKNLTIPGIINGGLKFNSVSVPPTVSAGIYDIGGNLIQKTSDTTLATSDALEQCSTSLQSFLHYLVVMNQYGTCKFLPYGEGAVSGATGNITSITGSGTTKTLTAATGTVGSHTGKILVVLGNNGFPLGVYKITGGNGSTTYTFEGPTGTTGGASGTWTVYERIKTLHGTGSSVAITTDADVLKYTPSYGENGWDAGIVSFDSAKNGYYLNLTGYTNWRVIGNFRTNTTPNVLTNIVSHSNGRNKRDNTWDASGNNGLAATNTGCLRISTINQAFGCDYILVPNNATLGLSWTAKRGGFFTGNVVGGATSSPVHGLTKNSTVLTGSPFATVVAENFGGIAHQASNFAASTSGNGLVAPEDVIRWQSSLSLDYVATYAKFSGSLVL